MTRTRQYHHYLSFLFIQFLVLLFLSPSFPAPTPQLTVLRNIVYDGGPVLSGEVNVYLIFYGKWEIAHQNVIIDFLNNIGDSTWFNTLKLYQDVHGQNITGPLKVAAGVNDNYSHGSELHGNMTHAAIIAAAIDSGYLGSGIDYHGLYFILATADVTDDDLCKKWCAYNSWTSDYIYAFIGHPQQCPQLCLPKINNVTSPNGDVALDGVIGMISHELQNLLTDPVGSGWRVAGSSSFEIANVCLPPLATTEEWFGPAVLTDDGGAQYNLEQNGKKYLIQTVWNPVSKICVMGS